MNTLDLTSGSVNFADKIDYALHKTRFCPRGLASLLHSYFVFTFPFIPETKQQHAVFYF